MASEAVGRCGGIASPVGRWHRHAAGAGASRPAGAGLHLNVNSQFRNGFVEFVAGVPGRGDCFCDQAGGQIGVEDFPLVRFVGIVDEIAVDVLDNLLELLVIL